MRTYSSEAFFLPLGFGTLSEAVSETDSTQSPKKSRVSFFFTACLLTISFAIKDVQKERKNERMIHMIRSNSVVASFSLSQLHQLVDK